MRCKKYGGVIIALILAALLIAGCDGTTMPPDTDISGTQTTAETPKISDTSSIGDTPTLGDTIGIDGAVSLTLSGKSVTISKAGTYLVSGKIENGQLIIDAGKDDKVTLILNGVDISCSSSAAIYIKQADKVTLSLNDGSVNLLSTTGSFVNIDENNIDAVIFSKEDFKIDGGGKLNITTESGNGITSKDDLTISDGIFNITASGHALEGKDLIEISGGGFTLVSGKDGLHSENNDDTTRGTITVTGGSFNITAQGDGLDASADIKISGGDFVLICGGGSPEKVSGSSDFGGFGFRMPQTATVDTTSAKGIKSDGDLVITGGSFDIDSLDDGVHSNTNVTVDGGNFSIATGDDGFHAGETLTINNGIVDIIRSYEGLEGQTVVINGGDITIISASDDGINAAGGNDASGIGGPMRQDVFSGSSGEIRITGGIIRVNADGDGLDSNGGLYVSGGELYVSGPTSSGNGALDYDGTAQITGGVVIAAGSAGMAQNFGSQGSTQASMLVMISGAAEDKITVSDKDGNELAVFTPDKSYQCVIISLPELKVGETYTVTAGSNKTEVALTSLIIGGSQGGFGGNMGGRGGR